MVQLVWNKFSNKVNTIKIQVCDKVNGIKKLEKYINKNDSQNTAMNYLFN